MKKISKSAVVIIIIAIAAAAALIFIYLNGKDHYENRFFQGTFINGWDYSDATVEEVKEDLQNEILTYSLTIKERGGTEEIITGSQIGLKYVDSGEVDGILANQDLDTWFLHQGGEEYSVSTAYSFDEAEVEKLVDALDCFKPENIIKPENAFIVLQEDGFAILPEVEGNELDRGRVVEEVKKAVRESTREIDLEALGFYAEPEIRSTDPGLNSEIAGYNSILSSVITYDFVDRQFVVDKDELISWMVQGEDGTYTLDKAPVDQWVYNMAYETDTFGLGHPFVTSTGVEIKLEGGGDYGWCIDQEVTAANLYNYLLAGQVATIQPDYLYTAMDRSTYDIGNTYVEVCISTQTLWCYYNGQLVTSTPVITGCIESGHSTPSGSVWAIDGKKDDWKFTNYANAYSDYWMPFNGEVGLHDASWQLPEYYTIPDFYVSSGSHGCVNIPLDAMEKIFYYMEISYPVVVYYSTDQVVGPAPTEALEAGI